MTDDDPLVRATAGVPTLVSLYFVELDGRPPKRMVARRVLDILEHERLSHSELCKHASRNDGWVFPARNPINSGKLSAVLRELGRWHLVMYTFGGVGRTRSYEITEQGKQVLALLRRKKPSVSSQNAERTTASGSRPTSHFPAAAGSPLPSQPRYGANRVGPGS